MSRPAKVDFISTLRNPEKLKWYHSYAHRLRGDELAEKLQALIDERTHQGYELIEVLQNWGSLSKKGKKDWRDAGQYISKPDGLLVIFKKV